MKKMIIVLGLILAIASITFYALMINQSPTKEFKGNVDIRTVNSSFRVAGRLMTLTVDEGAIVKKGERLGTIDNAPILIAYDEANANLEAQKARLLLMEKGTRLEERIQAEERLKAAKAQFTNADLNLIRQKKLENSGASKESLLDEAIANFDSTKASLEVAKQALTIAQKPFRDEEIAQAKSTVKQAQAQLNSLKLQLEDTQLIAPSAGVILTRALEPGTMVSNGTPILTISLTDPVWIRAYVDEPNLGIVVPGKKVNIYTDSRKTPYTGIIGFVSPNAEFTPKNIETTELRTSLVYRFRVIVQDPDEKMRQGMPVTITLQD